MTQKLASKYFRTRFVKVFVENAPFLVTKLGVKVLPAVFMFVDGISKDRSELSFNMRCHSLMLYRLVGFEELGNVDDFATSVLEARLMRAGMFTPQKPFSLC